MGFFDKFFGGKEGVYPEAETFKAPDDSVNLTEEVIAVDAESVQEPDAPALDTVENSLEAVLDKSRQNNIADAQVEANYINKKEGEYLKNAGAVVAMAERFGDEETARQYRKDLVNSEEAIDLHLRSLDKLIVEAAKKNVGLAPFISRGKAAQSGELLYDYLNNSSQPKLTDFDPKSRGDFDFDKLEYVAGKLGTEVLELIERKPKGGIIFYPVVKLAESANEMTFITNGAGLASDYHPRVFKMKKDNMIYSEYRLETKDQKVVFPAPEQTKAKA